MQVAFGEDILERRSEDRSERHCNGGLGWIDDGNTKISLEWSAMFGHASASKDQALRTVAHEVCTNLG